MKRHYIVIFITVLAAMISIATFNPILGPLTRGMGLTEIQSGSLVTITGIFWILGSFIWAKWVRIGRKIIMISALLGYATTVGAFAIIADTAQQGSFNMQLLYWVFLGLRAIAGFFFGAIPTMAQGYLMEWTTADNRSSGMALFGAANGLGFVLGPAMGAALSTVGLTAPMYVSAGLLIVVILLFWSIIPVSSTIAVQEMSVKLSPLDPRIRLYISIGLILSTVMIMLQVTSGFYMQDRMGVTAQDASRMTGLGLTITGMFVVFSQILIGRFLKLQPGRLLSIGLSALGTGFLMYLLAPGSYGIAFSILGIGIGFTMPGYTTAASLAVSDKEQGAVASFAAAVQGVGSFVGPIVGTILYSLQSNIPYILCVCLVGVFVPVVFLRPRQGSREKVI
ncbi:MFS transporter [Bacillus sp. FJAT-27264]|uniref:MFS transporter n=1 Tax=Paenibacillus sp. (strain DSM 101736 / FJAT-27264) TaxID=1850362 RepID=UPI000807FC4C|nr:MFS transporter [Bacillus sp. FJAT-27264]OBZ18620.1 MFS transporter [Bacillus sp. FJAT-27264]